MIRRSLGWAALLLVGAAGAAGTAAGPAGALPQQQGTIDLLHSFGGQWQGPGEADGSSATGSSLAELGPLPGFSGRGALAIGAPESEPGGRRAAGSVYVITGSRAGSEVDLTALTGRGHRIDGGLPGDQLGYSEAALRLAGGDPGLAIGAPFRAATGRFDAGAVYVIDLRRLTGEVDLSRGPLPRAVVAVISGARVCAEAGTALAAAPSGARAGSALRGDSLIVGAPGDDPSGCPADLPGGVVGGNRGAAYLIAVPRLRGHLDLAHSSGAAEAFAGSASGDRAGSAVASAGRPGAILVGAPGASPLGRSAAGSVMLATTVGARVRTTFFGAAAGDALGSALASTPAPSARGAVDLALSAPQASPLGRPQAGVVYLTPAAGQPATVDLASTAGAGVRAREIDGAGAGDEAGYSLVAAGDLNGDGRPDLAVGAPFANSRTGADRIDNGAAYVVYGGSGRGRTDLLTLSSRGYAIYGARNSDEAGFALAGGQDENGDGRPDLLIGAPFAENDFTAEPSVGGSVYSALGFGAPTLIYPRRGLVTGSVGRRIAPLAPSRILATGATSFSVFPPLPPGLRLNPRTGVISGVPRAAVPGLHYGVALTDASGAANANLTVTVVRR